MMESEAQNLRFKLEAFCNGWMYLIFNSTDP